MVAKQGKTTRRGETMDHGDCKLGKGGDAPSSDRYVVFCADGEDYGSRPPYGLLCDRLGPPGCALNPRRAVSVAPAVVHARAPKNSA